MLNDCLNYSAVISPTRMNIHLDKSQWEIGRKTYKVCRIRNCTICNYLWLPPSDFTVDIKSNLKEIGKYLKIDRVVHKCGMR